MAKHDNERITLGDTASLATTAVGQLAHLEDLKDYKIADGEPDIRGWDVRTADGMKVGTVEDLLVDTAAMKVRYIEVELEKDVARDVADDARARAGDASTMAGARARDPDATSQEDAARFVLVPIGVARLDDEDDDVLLDAHAAQMAGIPSYSRSALTRDYERDVVRGYGAADSMAAAEVGVPVGSAATAGMVTDPFYADRSFDDRSFFGTRRKDRVAEAYVRRADDVYNAERGSPAGRRVIDGRDVSQRDRDLMDSPSDLDASVRDQINDRSA